MKWIPSPNYLLIKYYKWFNKWYFKFKGIQYGKNLQVYNKVYVTGVRGKICIGDNFHFTSGDGINPIFRNLRGCIHTASSSSVIIIGNHVGMSAPCIWIKTKLTIGHHVNIGGNCIILDTDVHQLDYLARRGEKIADKCQNTTTEQTAPITIEDDVWIGANCIILKGVTIGPRSVIGAGSVVSKNIPADCIAAGNPCKIIKRINENENQNENGNGNQNENGNGNERSSLLALQCKELK